MARELPGVKVEPVVGHLDLVTVDDLLLEDTVAVSQAVAPGGEVERSKAIKETSSQASETTVAQSSIMLLSDNVLDAEAELVQTTFKMLATISKFCLQASLTLGGVLETHVQHSIVESAAHEEFETEVVDALWVSEGLTLLSTVPVQNELVAKCQTSRRIRSVFVTIEHASGKGRLDMANDFVLEVLWSFESLVLAPLPCLTLRLGNGGFTELSAIFQTPFLTGGLAKGLSWVVNATSKNQWNARLVYVQTYLQHS